MEIPDKQLPNSPTGKELLDLYIHQHGLADGSLAVERDITIKNFLSMGAILLLQAGFFTTALKPHVVFLVCGLTIITISLASRAMTIFYGKYTVYLFSIASVYRKAYFRGKDGYYIIRKRDELQAEGKLPDSESLSLREFVNYRGALALINTVPAVIGLAVFLLGVFMLVQDAAPWVFHKSESVTAQKLSSVQP